MPAPLIWLGAACIGLYATNKTNNAYLKRKQVVSAMPGESLHKVKPVNGSIVTCGIYGVLDHTGIWVNGNIYELSGQGLVRCISASRFLGDRSGTHIYIACNAKHEPLYKQDSIKRVQDNLFTFREYHLLNQNCHKFVAEMLSNKPTKITSFSDLNTFLHTFFGESIQWNLSQIN